jgi:hypothetical protein
VPEEGTFLYEVRELEYEYQGSDPVILLLSENKNMQAERIDHMLRFTFQKSSEEIKEKAKTKITALKAKVEERQKRVAKTRNEYGVTDEVWSGILEQMREKANTNVQSYSVSNNMKSPGNGKASEEITIPAGVVNSILTEKDYISAETAQVTKLDLIVRNLKDLKDEHGEVCGHKLSESELTYLGF